MRRGLGFHARRSPGGFNPLSLFAGGINGAWYDPSDATTLFSDRAGTTPCATPGAGAVVPVGLMLDKSQGLVLGTNIQNGGFDSDTVWTKNGWTISGGTASYASGAGAAIEQASPVTLTAGDWVRVTVTISAITSGFVYAYVAGSVTSALGIAATRTSSAGTYTWYFPIATVVNQNVGISCGNSPTGIVIDNVSIQKVAGNHAIAANDTTARPELSARVNLLTRTEEFNNAVWNLSAASVTPNTVTAPNGTLTADTLSWTTAGSTLDQGVTVTSGVSYIFSVYMRVASGSRQVDIGNINVGVWSTVTVTTDWQLFTVTQTASAALRYPGFRSGIGGGGSDVFIWGADLRPTNIGSQIPAYQRVADQYTYDSTGFPRRLVFNGTSSAMSTPANVNLSGTDKATVFLGLRKANDNSAYVPLEFSNASGWTVANGSFAIYAPSYLSGSFPAPKYFVGLRGTTQRQEEFSTFTAPITNVLSESIDIAAAAGSEISMRVNGAVVSPSATAGDAGSGNFGNYPISIGVRPTGSAYFPGDIYSLIVVGSAVSAGNITATETWVNGKTGGVY